MSDLVDWINAHGVAALLLGFASAWFLQAFRLFRAEREAYRFGREKMAEEIERAKDFLVPGQPCAECGVLEGPCAHYELNPYDEATSPVAGQGVEVAVRVLQAAAAGRETVPVREVVKWHAQAGAAAVRPRRFKHKGPGGRYRIGAWESGGPNDKWTGCDLSVENVRWYREAAEHGDADAQFNLGYAYYKGEGVAKDPAEAVRWYRKAAEQGHAGAQHDLGYAYYNAVGVSKDVGEALRWSRKAAEQGDADAQRNVGLAYRNGEGVAKDLAEAVRWYRKAAEQGNARAQCNLGIAYDNGEGVAKDPEEAVLWYRKAAEQGDANAQGLLGCAYCNGEGVAKDPEEGVRWIRKAAEQGDAHAQGALANALAQM